MAQINAEQQALMSQPPPQYPTFQAPTMQHMNPKAAALVALAGLLFKKMALPAASGIAGIEGTKAADYQRQYQAAQDTYASKEKSAEAQANWMNTRISRLTSALGVYEKMQADQQRYQIQWSNIQASMRKTFDTLAEHRWELTTKDRDAMGREIAHDNTTLQKAQLDDAAREQMLSARVGAQLSIARMNQLIRSNADAIRAAQGQERLQLLADNNVFNRTKGLLSQQIGVMNSARNVMDNPLATADQKTAAALQWQQASAAVDGLSSQMTAGVKDPKTGRTVQTDLSDISNSMDGVLEQQAGAVASGQMPNIVFSPQLTFSPTAQGGSGGAGGTEAVQPGQTHQSDNAGTHANSPPPAPSADVSQFKAAYDKAEKLGQGKAYLAWLNKNDPEMAKQLEGLILKSFTGTP